MIQAIRHLLFIEIPATGTAASARHRLKETLETDRRSGSSPSPKYLGTLVNDIVCLVANRTKLPSSEIHATFVPDKAGVLTISVRARLDNSTINPGSDTNGFQT